MPGPSKLFFRIAELAAATHGGPLNTHAGIWRQRVGEYEIELNPHAARADGIDGFHAVVSRHGWPAIVVGPGGGIAIVGCEDDAIRSIEDATRATGREPVEES